MAQSKENTNKKANERKRTIVEEKKYRKSPASSKKTDKSLHAVKSSKLMKSKESSDLEKSSTEIIVISETSQILVIEDSTKLTAAQITNARQNVEQNKSKVTQFPQLIQPTKTRKKKCITKNDKNVNLEKEIIKAIGSNEATENGHMSKKRKLNLMSFEQNHETIDEKETLCHLAKVGKCEEELSNGENVEDAKITDSGKSTLKKKAKDSSKKEKKKTKKSTSTSKSSKSKCGKKNTSKQKVNAGKKSLKENSESLQSEKVQREISVIDITESSTSLNQSDAMMHCEDNKTNNCNVKNTRQSALEKQNASKSLQSVGEVTKSPCIKIGTEENPRGTVESNSLKVVDKTKKNFNTESDFKNKQEKNAIENNTRSRTETQKNEAIEHPKCTNEKEVIDEKPSKLKSGKNDTKLLKAIKEIQKLRKEYKAHKEAELKNKRSKSKQKKGEPNRIEIEYDASSESDFDIKEIALKSSAKNHIEEPQFDFYK